jgi:hypothetical protein
MPTPRSMPVEMTMKKRPVEEISIPEKIRSVFQI